MQLEEEERARAMESARDSLVMMQDSVAVLRRLLGFPEGGG